MSVIVVVACNPNKLYYNALLPPLMPIAPIILNILQADLAQITN